jgi:hypothetical protein
LSGTALLVAAAIEVQTSGEVRKVEFEDAVNFGASTPFSGSKVVPTVSTEASRECLRRAYSGLKFKPYTIASTSSEYRCPEGAAVFNPQKFCTPVVEDSRTYQVSIMVEPDGRAATPTHEEAVRVAMTVAHEKRVAACAETKNSGFRPGMYTGEASQRVIGRDGSKVSEWMSLSITVGADGCATWVGLERGDIAMPGDDARNTETAESTCIYEGDATISGTKEGFRLVAKLRSIASGGTPTKYHLWKCGGLTVRTDLQRDLRSSSCQLLGGATSEPADRAAAFACGASRPFEELKDRTLAVQKDRSVRVPLTIVERGTIILRRVDSEQ